MKGAQTPNQTEGNGCLGSGSPDPAAATKERPAEMQSRSPARGSGAAAGVAEHRAAGPGRGLGARNMHLTECRIVISPKSRGDQKPGLQVGDGGPFSRACI